MAWNPTVLKGLNTSLPPFSHTACSCLLWQTRDLLLFLIYTRVYCFVETGFCTSCLAAAQEKGKNRGIFTLNTVEAKCGAEIGKIHPFMWNLKRFNEMGWAPCYVLTSSRVRPSEAANTGHTSRGCHPHCDVYIIPDVFCAWSRIQASYLPFIKQVHWDGNAIPAIFRDLISECIISHCILIQGIIM